VTGASDEATRAPRRWAALLLPVVILAALVAGVIASDDLRALVGEAIQRVRPMAVVATLPGQLVATLLCAAALHALRPGVSFGGSLGSRLLRDAGGNLLVFMPGLGEAIGTRALVLAGGRTRAAVSASALDTFAEMLAQLPFIALALSVVPRFWNHAHLPPVHFPAEGAGAALLALAVAIAAGATWWRHGGRDSRLARWLRAEGHLLRRELEHQRAGLPASIVLHILAWIMGGVQLWMAARAMGLDLTLGHAIAIDSVAYAARGILFFVPAGLVLQEAGLVGAGLAFGLAPETSLALGLVLRLRDGVFGVALLLWPALEWRSRRRR
jgi:hypothetical protein